MSRRFDEPTGIDYLASMRFSAFGLVVLVGCGGSESTAVPTDSATAVDSVAIDSAETADGCCSPRATDDAMVAPAFSQARSSSAKSIAVL